MPQQNTPVDTLPEFLKLTDALDAVVYVNPSQVVTIKPSGTITDGAAVVFSGGTTEHVKEAPKLVYSMVRGKR